MFVTIIIKCEVELVMRQQTFVILAVGRDIFIFDCVTYFLGDLRIFQLGRCCRGIYALIGHAFVSHAYFH